MHYEQALINQVSDECCENIGDLLFDLGVDYTVSRNRLYGVCPIHDGDNPSAWSLYPGGDMVRGTWICRTHHCEQKWKRNLLGFVHAILSKRAGHKVMWTDAVKYMIKFLGYKHSDQVTLPSKEVLERRALDNAVGKLNILPDYSQDTTWEPDYYRGKVQLPSQYFLKRGFSEKILKKYDVGFSKTTNRSTVPIYDLNYKKIVGITARTLYNKCSSCGYFHEQGSTCPTTLATQANACKWKNSPGFEAAHHLYNMWFARKFIMDSSTIIIVEGPGDVWRLEEAGIHNAVAIFGTDITEEQIVVIESSWCMNVIVMTDNDDAGRMAAKNIKKKLSRTHRLFFPKLSGEDVGELQVDQVTDEVKPIINNLKKFNDSVGVTI